ncbi:hypothetical protein [Actinospica acidiphila]|uniref:hypothetical protein n=1 Tax=Actinospica acidiphila TaxID=304899 RepID=UPI0013D4B32B|nr:hypothetical protein [Actinospica acidiphila]
MHAAHRPHSAGCRETALPPAGGMRATATAAATATATATATAAGHVAEGASSS